MIVFPDLGKQISCICSAVVVTCMHVHVENLKIKEIYNRYLGPNVLYISQMLLYNYIVFEILNGFLTEMLMPTDTSST